jgi:chemotaxis protein MotB
LFLLACLSGVVGAGCAVSRPNYERILHERDALRHEVDRARVESAQRATRLAAVEAQLDEAGAERDARLSEWVTEQAGFVRKLDELADLNAELSGRLRSAGEHVEQLARERGSLSAALEEAERERVELRQRQVAAEARVAGLRELAAGFQGMVGAGRARVAARDGHALLELPSDALFHPGKATLTPAGRATILDVARGLRAMPSHRFQVAVHVDEAKPERARFESSWHLSAGRAAEVVKLLVERGVPPQRLSAAGYGEFAPVAPNATPEGRTKNRRLEITVVPEADEPAKARAGTAAAVVAAAPRSGG